MTWGSIWTKIVLKGSIHKKNTVKKCQQGQKQFKPVKIGQNGQGPSKGINTVKKGEQESKIYIFLNGEKNIVNKVKNGQKQVTTVKTGQYGQNWFFKNQNSQQR